MIIGMVKSLYTGLRLYSLIIPITMRYVMDQTSLGPTLKLFVMLVFQKTIGFVFTGMGLATLLFPVTTMRLSLRKSFLGPTLINKGKEWELHPALKFVVRCFGSQATLCGIVLLSTKMTKNSFAVFGASIIPFVVFDIAAWKRGMLTAFGALGDGIGNLIFLACSYLAYKEL